MITKLLLLCLTFSVVLGVREFKIDYENNQFLKDGKPFRYISGSIHYNRVPSFYWYDRLSKMKAAGLNAVQTYIFWNFHETFQGQFDFDGDKDIVNFLRIANQLDLAVILRLGPYSCGEWDAGGFPYWIYKHRDIKVRTSDPKFLQPVKRWYAELMPRLVPMLYKNGGPIILMQIENEYGSHPDLCNITYTTWLRDLMRTYVGYDSQLITDDGGSMWFLKCGFVPDVYPTVDFGTWNQVHGAGVNQGFSAQKTYAPRGPSVNTEFYPGWLDQWNVTFPTVATQAILDTMGYMNKWNASFNFYMFEGGSNFAHWAEYSVTQTYDYDAPLTEAGDPTPKLYAIKNKIEKILGTHVTWPMPPATKKTAYGTVSLRLRGTFFDLLDTLSPVAMRVTNKYPLSMEDIDFPFGFIMYQTTLPSDANALILDGSAIKDRGYVFVGQQLQGIIVNQVNSSMRLTGHRGQKINILVENSGRRASGYPDIKGLCSNVTLGGHILTDWTMYPIDPQKMFNVFDDHDESETNNAPSMESSNTSPFIPSVYTGILDAQGATETDTYFDPTGWNKGYFYINDHNLGKYWPAVGPQVTLYTPVTMINNGTNQIVVFELNSPGNCAADGKCSIRFDDKPYLNKTVPNDHTWQDLQQNQC